MFTVLVVDGSGRRRATTVAALLRVAVEQHSSDDHLRIVVGGTDADGGQVDAHLMTALRKRGVDPATVDAVPERPLRRVDVQLADLVLTMERRQRGRAVELAPEAVRRVFCLREFADLAPAPDAVAGPAGSLTPVERLALVVDGAADVRGLRPPSRSVRDEAVPGHGGRLPLSRATSLRSTETVVRRVAAILTGAQLLDRRVTARP